MKPFDRLAFRLATRRLDQALAAGAAPTSDAHLAKRARALTARDKRNQLAEALGGIAHRDPASRGMRLTGSREATNGARPDLERLARRLTDPSPVEARGVVLVRHMLSDGTGPLLWEQSREDLRASLREALGALEPSAAARSD